MNLRSWYYPIITVNSPIAAAAPVELMSIPALAAGFPPIKTVVLPVLIGLGGAEVPGGGVHISPITAAGTPPISTVGTPGPKMVPPWLVVSNILAAAGIVF